MNFYRWMVRNQSKAKNPVGDLARDMKTDKEIPHDGNREQIRAYLENCGASSGCMDAFEKAFDAYERKRDRTGTCQ